MQPLHTETDEQGIKYSLSIEQDDQTIRGIIEAI